MAEYIERERVFEQIAEAIAPWGLSRRCRDDIIYAVANVPAADVRPERHGKWVGDVALYPRCSVCNGLAGYAIDGTHEPTAYCPNCGAKMDGEENSEDRQRYEVALAAIPEPDKREKFIAEWQDGRSSMNDIGTYCHKLADKLNREDGDE